ncbi:MAG: hypothetical protein HWQ36_26325 [Nostoc sp. NMS2]|uniref:hypothetical protein n=1 Tax=Nostoc sp. NMS2 TaxID=2815389 RepID=UPI002600EC23|nr:hypothetical protein [Nostoc sp. NMS2]MBN3993905.1 hypothetical protein [Nostoc sp. NMS2]
MPNITILKQDELDKKHQLEQSVISGIETGKKGFQQAAQALLRIDELGLWRDEANNFDQYRDKFRELLADTDVSFRRLNQLIASARVITILGTIVPKNDTPKESHLRPLTGLKNPKDIQKAYKTAVSFAESEGSQLKAEHVKKAVEEIKPPKIRNRKPPRPPIGATVQILPHYPDEELHGAEGVVAQHSSVDRCIVRFGDENSKLIPDNMLVVVEKTEGLTSAKAEGKAIARSFGLKTGLQAIPDPKEIPTETQQLELELALAKFLRLLPRFSQQQKGVIYEQLMKSGFRVEVAA